MQPYFSNQLKYLQNRHLILKRILTCKNNQNKQRKKINK